MVIKVSHGSGMVGGVAEAARYENPDVRDCAGKSGMNVGIVGSTRMKTVRSGARAQDSDRTSDNRTGWMRLRGCPSYRNTTTGREEWT